VDDALAFAGHCGARRLVLTHHPPDRADEELDLHGVAGRTPQVGVAIQGTVLDLR